MRRAYLLLLAVAFLAPTAQALFIETPLHLTLAPQQAEPGMDVDLDAAPANGSTRDAYAGKTVKARYAIEGQESTVYHEIGDLVLDGDAKGRLRWKVSADVDDQNVLLQLVDGEEVVGIAHLAVGDAPPMMYAMGGGPADSEVVEETPRTEGQKDTPMPGLLALAVAVGLAAVVALRRRG